MNTILPLPLAALLFFQQAPVTTPYEHIYFERENCVGCLPGGEPSPPQYSITLNRSGVAQLLVRSGKAFDQTMGTYSGKVSDAEYAQLFALTQQLAMEKMSSVYGRLEEYEVHHGATMIIQLQRGNNLQVIIERDLAGPRELRTFQTAIETLAQRIQWNLEGPYPK